MSARRQWVERLELPVLAVLYIVQGYRAISVLNFGLQMKLPYLTKLWQTATHQFLFGPAWFVITPGLNLLKCLLLLTGGRSVHVATFSVV